MAAAIVVAGVRSVWASYIHIHLGSDPALARRFVETCARPSGERYQKLPENSL